MLNGSYPNFSFPDAFKMLIKKNYLSEKKALSYSLAIGNFDGIHEGHRYLLGKLKSIKKDNSHKIAVLSFAPHPIKLLAPNKWNKNLVKFRTKYKQLKALGVDVLFIINFNQKFSRISAEQFINEYLIEKLHIKNIVVGEDFKFGHNRKGDIKLLEYYANKKKFNLICLKKIGSTHDIYSSSLIRKLIKLGQIERANKILGYNWEVTGKVIRGKSRGRQLGYPTANLKYLYQIAPSKGIYACWTKVERDAKWYMSVASTGNRPHYKGIEEILEVYIFHYSGNLYQKRIRVAFVKKIRDEEAFNSESQLIKKMKEDCEKVKLILSRSNMRNDNKGKT